MIIDNFSIFYLSDQDSIMSHSDITFFQGAWNVVDKDHKGVVNDLRAKFCLRLMYKQLELDGPMVLKRMFQEIRRSQVRCLLIRIYRYWKMVKVNESTHTPIQIITDKDVRMDFSFFLNIIESECDT